MDDPAKDIAAYVVTSEPRLTAWWVEYTLNNRIIWVFDSEPAKLSENSDE